MEIGNTLAGYAMIALFTAIGYFIYGVDGAIAIFILGFLYAISTLLGLIPFCGFIVQILVMRFCIFPGLNNLTGLTPSILTWAMFIYFAVFGVIFTVITTSVALLMLRD